MLGMPILLEAHTRRPRAGATGHRRAHPWLGSVTECRCDAKCLYAATADDMGRRRAQLRIFGKEVENQSAVSLGIPTKKFVRHALFREGTVEAEFAVKHIRLITFRGCQSTVDFQDALENAIAEDGLDFSVEMVQVPSPESAESYGLHGSPTILVDGAEYQEARRGPAGFY